VVTEATDVSSTETCILLGVVPVLEPKTKYPLTTQKFNVEKLGDVSALTQEEFYDVIYLSSGKIITLYGEHNAERMRPYIRLDLSADFTISEKAGRQSVLNLSVYNVLARENEVMYRLYINDEGFSFDYMSFPLILMPSLSYCYRF
jgi:hypothetical protein